MFTATLKINDTNSKEANKSYTGRGETIFDALSSIPLEWFNVKTKGVIEVSDGERNAEKLFYGKQLRNLIRNHLLRSGFAHQFETLLRY